jgi:hypothetical protein
MPRRIVRKKQQTSSGMAGFVEPGYGSILVRAMWHQKFKESGKRPSKRLKQHTKHSKRHRKQRSNLEKPQKKVSKPFERRTRFRLS